MKRYTLRHDPARQRYSFDLGDGEQAVIDYLRRGDTLHLLHTGVPSRFEGQGIAAELTEAVLAEIRAQELRIVPECSYIARYIERHPEWRQLVAGRS